MTIASNFPATKPSLMLDFANTKRLDPRVTFTRATTATYYDGVTTAKAEENLLLQSQDFTTTWSNTGTTDTANTSVAPDGTTTADTITEDSATSFHVVSQGLTSSGVVTLSVFAKLGSGSRYLTIGVSKDASNNGSATFDLSGGTSTQTQVNGTFSSASATITAVAQSFYRCTLTVTTDSVASVRIGLNNTSTPTTSNRGFGADYLGDGTSSLILWGAQLEQRSAVTSYTATTTQPITNYIPVLLTAASGVPRFDHNPTTDESLGLLIEEQRTNTQTRSEEFNDTGAWTVRQTTVTANTIVAPSGSITGDTLTQDTANNTHGITSTIVVTSGTTYCWSVFLKAGLSTVAQLTFGNTGGTFSGVGYANFNLSTGVVSATGGTLVASGIQSVGNGWYRCWIVATATASAATNNWIVIADSTTYTRLGTYTGNGYSGIYIWGAQVEAGAFPTSYIATTAAGTVTRNADAASMTGTNFSSWYNAAEGTLYAEINPKALAASSGAVINDNTTSNRIRIATASTSDQTLITTSGTAQATLDAGTPVIDTSMKLASSYKVNDFALSLNGGTVATDTAGTVPVVTQLQIGAETTTIGTLTIKKLAYYPLRVTNAQLQALTS
jgi:hypothetical protein